MREQSGYTFHKGKSWFVRYCDDVVVGPDGATKRKLVCKKLDVPFGGEYTTEKAVRVFVKELLAPVNAGILNAQSTMTVVAFVETVYLPQYVAKELSPATLKQYRDVWKNHIKPRMGNLTLRGFRTVDAQQIITRIAEQAKLGRSSLRHCKAFLSGSFRTAKNTGVLNGVVNPVQGIRIPRVPESEEDGYAYNLSEIKSIMAALKEPALTVVMCAAFTGLSKSELRGLRWRDFTGDQIHVRRSVWNSTTNPTKTRSRKAPVPVVKQLADALEAHRHRAGVLAQPDMPIFQAGNLSPLNLDNLARRAIRPAIEKCVKCRKSEGAHKPDGHAFELDKSLAWYGWHAFRRGLATNLDGLEVKGKSIQAMLRHSNIKTTQNIYIKARNKSTAQAMETLADSFGAAVCTNLTTAPEERIN